jgi:hypothetical protein
MVKIVSVTLDSERKIPRPPLYWRLHQARRIVFIQPPTGKE